MRQKEETQWTGEVPVPTAEEGLSDAQAADLTAAGLSNADAEVKAKPLSQIFSENVFTLFNFLNFALGAIVIMAGAYQNALFLNVVLFNLSIGIINQIRAKRAVEKLSLLSKVQVKVIRSGKVKLVDFAEVVLHDVLVLEPGSQIPADCRIVEGSCEADETMLTGESDTVYRQAGDMLLSGSYVVSGNCRAIAERVGKESYAAKVANETRVLKKTDSKILDALNSVIKVLTLFIVIMGTILFLKEKFVLQEGMKDAILSTTAAVIGMIPEGLILLTNVALAVGTIKLARKQTLVQEMYAIETLARTNMLCIDKTGTITDGTLEVDEAHSFGMTEADWQDALRRMLYAVGDDNATARAIKQWLPQQEGDGAYIAKMNFSSARKWSGATLTDGTYILGAPGAIASACQYSAALQADILQRQEQSLRVLVFARGEQPLSPQQDGSFAIDGQLEVQAILCFSERVRPEANEIFAYLRENRIGVKVISGDSARTVYAIAQKAGAECRGYADVYGMDDEALTAILDDTDVFGRVSPQQKKLIVRHFKAQGNTVAMTGDGVNDVPALREADCSITLRTGSDAARTISQIVLMDSNLYAIYDTIMEGNLVINNIQRSASLFLVKTIFSCLLTALFMLLPLSYPFYPIQLTLISSLCIGVPGFLLTFQRRYGQIGEDFFGPVLKRAFPGALGIVTLVLTVCTAGALTGMTEQRIAMLSAIAGGIGAFTVLYRVMKPYDIWKGLLFGILLATFIGAMLLFPSLFFFEKLDWQIAIWAAGMFGVNLLLAKVYENITAWILEKFRMRNNRKQAEGK